MGEQSDTSTRKGIKGARVPLTLLAVLKTRVDELHKSALWVSATASDGCEHESSLVEGGSSVGGPRRNPTFVPGDLQDSITTRQPSPTNWHTSMEFTSELKNHYIHTGAANFTTPPPLQSQPNFGSSQSRCFSWRNKTVVFLRPLSHLTRILSSCRTIGPESPLL
jgi:hypothetical protein